MILDPQVIALAVGMYEATVTLPMHWQSRESESLDAYKSRVAVINTATAIVASEAWPRTNGRWRIGMALHSLTYGETKWSYKVHAGIEVGDRGRAACLGQLHHTPSLPREDWEMLVLGGTDIEATTACIRQTWITFHAAFKYCRSSWDEEGVARAYTLYGTGTTCEPKPWARNRAKRWAILVNGRKPTGITATALNEYAVEREWVKELPSLLGPPENFKHSPGLQFSTLDMRAVVSQPDQKIVDTLTELLTRARAGEIRSFIGFAVDDKSKLETSIHVRSGTLRDMHFALSRVASDLIMYDRKANLDADRG